MCSARWTGKELDAEVYRSLARPGKLHSFRIRDGETDILLSCHGQYEAEAACLVSEAREEVKMYIQRHPGFQQSLVPWPDDAEAPAVVRAMLLAGIQAEVGPMAAVAGAISQMVGQRMLALSPEIIAENGGDVFCRCDAPQRFGIVAESSRSAFLQIEVAETMPGAGIGVCTSSGRLGPSLNFGNADAVTVVAADTALADALATAASNRVRRQRDIADVLDWTLGHGADGCVIVAFDQVAAKGNIRFAA